MSAPETSAVILDITTPGTFLTNTPNPLTHAHSVKHNLTVSDELAFTMNQIKTTHQAAYEYAMATIKQSAGENMLDQALRTLGSDNQIIDLCEPILVPYRRLLTLTIGPELMDWLDWWMYETEHGTKPMHFSINGKEYDPTQMTLYKFLEIVDAS